VSVTVVRVRVVRVRMLVVRVVAMTVRLGKRLMAVQVLVPLLQVQPHAAAHQ
jgi:hypothetical protein